MTLRRLSPACMWLGVLMLLIRVLGPATPMEDAGTATLAALFPGGLPICYVPDPSDPGSPAKAPAHDCQLCPSCRAASHAPLLPVEAVRVPAPQPGLGLDGIMLPRATEPPGWLWRRSTPPTGPPAPSI